MKRKFKVEVSKTVIVEIDDMVFDVVDEEWRHHFYNLHTAEDVAEHVSRNLLNDLPLALMDGWADQPSSNARIVEEEFEEFDVEELK